MAWARSYVPDSAVMTVRPRTMRTLPRSRMMSPSGPWLPLMLSAEISVGTSAPGRRRRPPCARTGPTSASAASSAAAIADAMRVTAIPPGAPPNVGHRLADREQRAREQHEARRASAARTAVTTSALVSTSSPRSRAIVARSSTGSARSLCVRVTTMRALGRPLASVASMPAASLSRATANTTPAGGSSSRSSRHAVTSRAAPSGLWAPSHHSRGSRGHGSRRPGQRARPRGPRAPADAGSVDAGLGERRDNVASAMTAFSTW